VAGSVDIGADEYACRLYHRGTVVPGGTIDMKVIGTPGMPVLLGLGSDIHDPPIPTQYGDLYIWPLVDQWQLPNIPGNGVLVSPFSVPPSWSPGEEHPFQALVDVIGNPDSVLTNLMVLEVE
jgi:hypothetical protein